MVHRVLHEKFKNDLDFIASVIKEYSGNPNEDKSPKAHWALTISTITDLRNADEFYSRKTAWEKLVRKDSKLKSITDDYRNSMQEKSYSEWVAITG